MSGNQASNVVQQGSQGSQGSQPPQPQQPRTSRLQPHGRDWYTNERIFQLIKHENEMVHQRMEWFLLLQGFMLAAVAFGWEKNKGMVYIFSVMGILTCVSCGVNLNHAWGAIEALRVLDNAKNGDPVIGRSLEAKDGYWRTVYGILAPTFLIPSAFSVGWLVLALTRHFNWGKVTSEE